MASNTRFLESLKETCFGSTRPLAHCHCLSQISSCHWLWKTMSRMQFLAPTLQFRRAAGLLGWASSQRLHRPERQHHETQGRRPGQHPVGSLPPESSSNSSKWHSTWGQPDHPSFPIGLHTSYPAKNKRECDRAGI